MRVGSKLGSGGGRPLCFDPGGYRARLGGECGIGGLDRRRAVAVRYGRLAVRYEGTVLVAAVDEWL
ncbi:MULTISPECIES: hypothetical protein [unclassified Streptomyces]|uniref:hypothetical protein n=1 Tax=Streptomyces sp. 029-5 TaxID=2789261 RepID=UPI00397EC385